MSLGFGFGFTKITAAIRAAFSPSSLFAANEPGVWYDPSDLSTLFQDAAGTTPVTAVEQPVGLMLDKSKGLTLGSERFPQPSFDATTGLTLDSAWVVSGGVATANGITGFISVPQALQVGKWYSYSIDVVSRTSGEVYAPYDGRGVNIRMIYAPGTYRGVFLAEATTLYIYSRTFVGSIDNISVRELPGNHASQTTATSRPVLSARYNLLTKTEEFDDASWTKTNATVIANAVVAPDGTLTADKVVATTATGFHNLDRGGGTGEATQTFSVYAKKGEYNFCTIFLRGSSIRSTRTFNLTTGEITNPYNTKSTFISAQAINVGNGWWRLTLSATSASFNGVNVGPALDTTNNHTDSGQSFTGDGTSGIYIWGADLRVANDGANLPPYQRVNTATDYDTAGFPHYLRFDGVDDWLVTNTITPGTDKVQVFAGVRKLSDAAAGVLIESSASFVANSGCFLLGPRDLGASTGLPWLFASRGSVNPGVGAETGPYAAPITQVISGLGDISGDRATLRVNGTQAAQNTADLGTGNYLAYPLYIGRRGGTTLPFNGHLYSLIVRFGPNPPIATIEQTEKYINTQTRAY